ncbi:MAG: hypothetical protein WEC17_00935 [Candidatus Saccharimonadales bacterium]
MFFAKLTIVLIGFFLLSGLLFSQVSAIDLFKDPCDDPQAQNSSVCQAKKQQGVNDPDPISGPGGIINKAANIIAIIGGLAAVIVIIISGIMYATAGGAAAGQRAGDSPNRAKNAQAAITGAVIGLVVIALAWAATRFIVDQVVQ